MNSTLKALLFTCLGMSVSFCSLFGATTEEKTENTPEQYSSSGVYNDIENAGNDRALSSEDYSDDDYGTLDAGGGSDDDELFASNTEGYQDEENNTAPSSMEEGSAGTEPLPVESLSSAPEEEPVSVPKLSKKVSSKFKNGMYKFSKACNMRKSPSKKGRTAGKVATEKKLWVEGHNGSWVKVYKKSGAVYVHKTCL